MEHPWHLFLEGARTARAEDRLALMDDLGLNEEIAERRMQRVRGGRREHDFRITRDFDRPACPGAVGDADPAQFDVVFRRNDDIGMRIEIVVAAAKLRTSLRKNYFVILRLLQSRVIGG